MNQTQTYQATQFDWRVVSTIGSSTASNMCRNGTSNGKGKGGAKPSGQLGRPLLQLSFDVARTDGSDAVSDVLGAYPSPINAMLPPTDRLTSELSLQDVDALIAQLAASINAVSGAAQ